MKRPGQDLQEALADLHDLAVPEAIPWGPQTAGWYVLFLVVLVLLVWLGMRALKKRSANRYRVVALEELAAIEVSLGSSDNRAPALAQLPILVKRVALSFTPRESVASLSGSSWLTFLDDSYQGSGFSEGPGRLLADLAYARPAALEEVDSKTAADLIGVVRSWIRTHQPAVRASERSDV